ncbi:hypothetical protein [Duganella vulcania]|uniref:Copper resistance protein CopB n=1 Tax=Duganella vulcania TaxID=2692166 RepID=A0A845GIN8_9BURK|nr:hypothetical protein [Duganella vulcania]MYM94154.1 hypothetical protein [Duganella vulcania]
MNHTRILMLAAACLPLLASAQATSGAADAGAKVVPPVYRSAFADFRRSEEPADTPDKAWLLANQALAGQPGHSMHMQMEPMAPAGMPKAEAGEDPHKGHHMHMKEK